MGRYLFVGLGNPGDRYANSRHNAGWLVVDELVARWNEGLNPQWQNEKKLQGVTCRVHRGSHELIFLKPQTYMNASGESVRAALAWYDRFSTEAGDNQEIPRLVIVHDDLDLALGSYKLQFASGPKAHNGLNSIRDHLHTQKFWVARVGIDGRNGDRSIPGEAYVLQPFSAPEQSTLKEISANIASELEYVVLQ